MVPGSAVIALAIEHTWALALVIALYQAGVDMALNFRVPALLVDEAFASLEKKECGCIKPTQLISNKGDGSKWVQ